jgi:putative membrane protein
VTAAVLAWALAGAGSTYLIAVARAAHRGPWPWRRTGAWCAGTVAAAAGVTLSASGGGTVHAVGHLLLGMLAPLLLVLSAPVTVALRALPADRARLLASALRSRPARVLAYPLVAGTLDAGGLWLIYTTGLHAHAAVGVHVLAAGYLFTASVVGVDPTPHRAPFTVRATALVLVAAAHDILAKHLYAGGWGTSAMVMYYGGDVIELALAALLCRELLAGRPRSAASAWSRAHRGSAPRTVHR